jgi:MFS transporter, ENTS family, enterobactin (siderophore) exporter
MIEEAAEVAVDAVSALSTAPSSGSVSADPSIWANRDFKIVLGGQSISAFGDAVTFTALPLFVAVLTGSGVAMGTVGALQTLPDLILGLPAGALADRWDRRRMMLWADFGRALLTALIPLAVLAGWNTMAVILLVTAPINALRVMFMAAYTAAVPSLVGRSQVGRANGYSEAILSLSFVIGPTIAGVLVSFVGAGPTLLIDAVSFLVSAGSLSLVRRPLQQARGAARAHLVADILEGLRYIVRQPTLRTVIVYWSLVSVVTAPLVTSVIFLLRIEQGRSPEVLGLIISAYGIGYTTGAVLFGRLARGRLGLFMLIANLFSAAMTGIFALVADPLLEGVAALSVGLSGALVLISYITLRATIPPDHLLGRVGSTARMLSLGLQPVGVFSGGLLLDVIGGRPTMLLISILAAAASVVFAFSPTMRGAVAGEGHA